MPMITFHCDRRIPDTSCVPILAALGIATTGFRVSYVRCEPDGSNGSHMMPYSIEGVDAVLGSVTCRTYDAPASFPAHADAAPPPSGCGDFLLVDAPMPDADDAGGFDGDALVAFVTRSRFLCRRRVPAGATTIHFGCDGVGRGAIRQVWDESLGGRRLAIPSLTAPETASLLSGVPLVRVRALARTLADELRETVDRDVALRGFAWPTASRRPAGRRWCPTASAGPAR